MNVFVKPRLIDDKPALVRDPSSGKPLNADGEWKSKSQFWMRRILQGDVCVDMTKEQTELQAKAAAPAARAAHRGAGSRAKRTVNG